MGVGAITVIIIILFYFILGCALPLQEAALHQSPATFSVLCYPCPNRSLLPHNVISQTTYTNNYNHKYNDNDNNDNSHYGDDGDGDDDDDDDDDDGDNNNYTKARTMTTAKWEQQNKKNNNHDTERLNARFFNLLTELQTDRYSYGDGSIWQSHTAHFNKIEWKNS